MHSTNCSNCMKTNFQLQSSLLVFCNTYISSNSNLLQRVRPIKISFQNLSKFRYLVSIIVFILGFEIMFEVIFLWFGTILVHILDRTDSIVGMVTSKFKSHFLLLLVKEVMDVVKYVKHNSISSLDVYFATHYPSELIGCKYLTQSSLTGNILVLCSINS
jgi:hypothetical protein